MKTKEKGLQKFTDLQLKFEKILESERVTNDSLQGLNEKGRELFFQYIQVKLTNSKPKKGML